MCASFICFIFLYIHYIHFAKASDWFCLVFFLFCFIYVVSLYSSKNFHISENCRLKYAFFDNNDSLDIYIYIYICQTKLQKTFLVNNLWFSKAKLSLLFFKNPCASDEWIQFMPCVTYHLMNFWVQKWLSLIYVETNKLSN